MLAPGTIVGNYRVEHVIGEGGMGAVYAAVEPTIGKRVAIKVLKAALSADDATKARFEREARAVNAVRHPAVVEVFAFGQLDDGSPYFVMSLLEGRSLREELDAKGPIAPAEAWRIMREVGDALRAAHGSNVVHRDLKPDNVFLESFPDLPPRPRVLDFGVAKVLDLRAGLGDDLDQAPLAQLTQTGAPIGTPAYMAPEQWWSHPTTARTDQYAFGATLFEMLTGKPPFLSKQYAELLQMHLNSTPPTLAERGFDASPEVEAFVAKLLSKAEADRFADFAAVLRAGDAAFGGSVESSRHAPRGPASELDENRRGALATGVDSIGVADTVMSPASSADARLPSGTAPLAPRASAVTSSAASAHAGGLGFTPTFVAIVAAGLGAIYAVGYAGEARRDVVQWVHNSGFSIFPVFAAFLVGLGWLFVAAPRRRIDTSPRYGAVFVSLSPLLPSVFATYLGWNMVLTGLRRVDDVPRRFQILNEGMFEVSTPRFLGFGLAAILLLGVSALFGVAPRRTSDTVVSIDRVEKRWSLGAAAVLAVAAVGFGLSGSPSAALVAGAGALAELVAFAMPTTHPDSAHRDARDRTIASGAAILLALGVGLARIEASEAALWQTSATRAARILEIVASARERQLTYAAAALTLAIFALVEVLRERRLRGRERPAPMPLSGWILGGVLVSTAALDVTFHQMFFSERARMIEAQREQFSLFAKLDPPSSDAPRLHEPHSAAALQVTSETIALGGRGIAKLGALDSPAGRANVGHDLTNALGAGAGGATDLSLVIDRRVPWSRVTALLDLGCQAGARRAEVLFTRGQALTMPRGAPPEAGELLPRDFGALDIELSEKGFEAPGGDAFADVAARLLERADQQPVELNLGCAHGEK